MALGAAPAAHASPLDLGFSGDGLLRISGFGSEPDENANAVAVQADGKIVVAGTAQNAAGLDFAVARLNPNGTPDTSFSGDGRTTVDLGASGEVVSDVAIAPGGKIVLVGQSNVGPGNQQIAVARLNSNGTPDTSFDLDGERVLGVAAGSGEDRAHGVAVQPDARIVIAGSIEQTDGLLLRLNENGSDDSGLGGDQTPGDSFGTGGRVVMDVSTDASDPYTEFFDVVRQPDGKYVAGGQANMGTTGGGADDTYQFALARFNADGSLDDGSGGDTTPGDEFGQDGIRSTNVGGQASANDLITTLALQGDGKILAGGYSELPGAGHEPALVRYTDDGAVDSFGPGAFGEDGKAFVFTGNTTNDEVRGIAVQPDGKIALAVVAGNDDFSVARLTAGGSADVTFDFNGLVTTDFGAGRLDFAAEVAVAPGRLVVVGTSRTPDTSEDDMAVAVYLQNDVDSDGRANAFDNCPAVGNPAQRNTDGKGRGDACNADADGDEVDNAFDNCRNVKNPGQANRDRDARGDACDPSIDGTAGNDNLVGTVAADVINGLAGNDTIRGLAGPDTLGGGAGRDTLNGGRGRDLLRGGGGNDTIRAADGKVDTVRCGKGKGDRAIVDPTDTISGCEDVTLK